MSRAIPPFPRIIGKQGADSFGSRYIRVNYPQRCATVTAIASGLYNFIEFGRAASLLKECSHELMVNNVVAVLQHE